MCVCKWENPLQEQEMEEAFIPCIEITEYKGDTFQRMFHGEPLLREVLQVCFSPIGNHKMK